MVVDTCIVGPNGDGNGGEDNVWPPGFRFHPTDEELVLYYLKRKICRRKLKLDIIRDIDVYKWDPEELPGQSLLKTGDRQWFFFTPRDRKYPNASRSNRATQQGYWKATGKDRNITCNSRNVGVKKTLVFYRGRAPSGERTDWVMHEYTMDEQELSRCPNVQDYYALYKVFKKSGPGPKNGEQYGAPFKEEDWAADDECADLNTSVTVDSLAKQVVEVACDDNDKIVLLVEQTVDELDELLKGFLDAPKLDLLPLTDNVHSEAQVSDGQTQGTVVGSLLTEDTFPEPIGALPAYGQDYETEAGFDLGQATAFMLQPDGTPLVMSAHNNHEAAPQLTVEDFLEMDDFIDSQPTLPNIHGSSDSLQFDSFNENHDLDIYCDAELFLRDLIDEQSLPNLDVNPLGNEMESPVGYQLQPNSLTNQGITGFELHSVVSRADYHLQPEVFVEEHITSQQMTHDQASGVFSSPTLIIGTHSQLSPGIEDEVFGGLTGADQNTDGEQGIGAGSSFASSIWAFLESIPSNPATAAENPLVNKALERMPSLSMLRMNAKAPNVIAGVGSAKKASLNRGFLFLSICVALCAILWLFLNGSLKVLLGRSVSL